MINNLPIKAQIAIVILLAVGVLGVWEWIESDFDISMDSIVSIVHGISAIGLILRINAARLSTIILPGLGILSSVLYFVLFGIWNYFLREDTEEIAKVLNSEASDGLTSLDLTNVFADLTWFMTIAALVISAIYFWLFMYMTTDEAKATFTRTKVTTAE